MKSRADRSLRAQVRPLATLMDLLALKLTFAPILLAAATLAVRRWGEIVGGLLVGLPLTSGPISVFLALEYGPAFAVNAASGALIATCAQTVFCLAYCRLSAWGWKLALSGACAAFVLVAGLLQWAQPSQTSLFLLTIPAILSTLALMPVNTARSQAPKPQWWDLPGRMTLIASLTVGVTVIAPYIGPGASGILASLPFMVSILVAFAHRTSGSDAAHQVLRGLVAGLWGFAVFFYVLSLALLHLSLPVAYGVAALCALAVQGVSLYRIQQAR